MKILNWEIEKKKFNNILIISILVIILLIIFGSSISDLGSGGNVGINSNNKLSQANILSQKNTGYSYEKQIDTELENILCKMKGVGKAKVMVTLETDDEIVPAINSKQDNETTNENDKSGTVRNTNQKNTENDIVILNKQSGDNSALIVKRVKPKINGVIVVAEGARNEQIQYNISKACEVVLNIEPDKVKVFEMN